MVEKRTVILVAGLPGQDFSDIRNVCDREGLFYAEINRNAPPADDANFDAALGWLNRCVLDLVSYGWADTRMLVQDFSRQNIDRRFEHWACNVVSDQFARVWDKAPANNEKPLVIVGDSLMPTCGILARLFRHHKALTQTVVLCLSSKEALAQFEAQVPQEVGIPGAQQLWLKQTLLALLQTHNQKNAFVAHWPSPETIRKGFSELLKTGKVVDGPISNAPPQERMAHPVSFDLIEATDTLLQKWSVREPECVRRTVGLVNSLRSMARLYGDVVDPPEALRRYRIPLALSRQGQKRAVILHYHFFKNAGTSVDVMLQNNFGQLCDSREFADEDKMATKVYDWVVERPWMRVFSSHTMTGPLPVIEDTKILPIMFIRHPIDRVKSAYLFERRQALNNRATELARSSSFADYVEKKLDRSFGQAIVNFNCARLSTFVPGSGTLIERALAALEALPFVGLVEQFDISVRRLEQLVRGLYPGAVFDTVLENSTRASEEGLEVRLLGIRQELGSSLYARLEAANADDLAIFARLESFYKNYKI